MFLNNNNNNNNNNNVHVCVHVNYTYLVNSDSYSIQAKEDVRSSNIRIAQSQPPPEPVRCGYDDDIFISTPPESLKCPVCLLILREPHQLTCCGVLICQVLQMHKLINIVGHAVLQQPYNLDFEMA